MFSRFHIKCLIEIEAAIQTPDRGFFIKNDDSIRLAYIIDDKLKYIYLTTPEEVAASLKAHNMIDGYIITPAGVKMYTKVLFTVTGPKGEPVQYQRMVEVKWEDIKLNSTQVQSFAAAHEFNLAGKIMGKVVEITKNYLKAA